MDQLQYPHLILRSRAGKRTSFIHALSLCPMNSSYCALQLIVRWKRLNYFRPKPVLNLARNSYSKAFVIVHSLFKSRKCKYLVGSAIGMESMKQCRVLEMEIVPLQTHLPCALLWRGFRGVPMLQEDFDIFGEIDNLSDLCAESYRTEKPTLR